MELAAERRGWSMVQRHKDALFFIFCMRKNQKRRHFIENKPEQTDEMILDFGLVEEMKWDGITLSHAWITL
jgi:hypothetical protein